MLLQGKTAIVYGAGGAIGGAVAKAFAREGAKVFMTGIHAQPLKSIAGEIRAAGGQAEFAEGDAFNADWVEQHIQGIVSQEGHLDISMNVVSVDAPQGTPLIEMQLADVAPPVERYLTTHFITAGAAARRMVRQGGGAILALTANASSEGFANVGPFGLSCAAIEAFCRQLASEVGSKGVRVVCLRSAGSPEAPAVDKVFQQHARALGISRDEFQKSVETTRFLKRLPTLAEIGNVAALAASDLASPVTGAVIEAVCGH